MVDIISEANSEANIEKMIRYLRRYALPVVILILVVAIAYSIWSHHNESVAIELGDKMYTVIISPDTPVDKKKEMLHEVINANHDYQYLATLALANLLYQEGQKEPATDLYNKLSVEDKADSYIIDLAKQKMMIINNEENNDKSNYYFTNMMLQSFSLLQQGKIEEGKNALKNLQANSDVPHSIKELANELNLAL